MGAALSLPEGVPLYYDLFKEIAEKRRENYDSLTKELADIEAKIKVEKEMPKEVKERQFEFLPQLVDQWRREKHLSLLSLRLKVLSAQVSRKTAEAQEMESQLQTAFQSLLSQWKTPPQINEPLPEPERITLTPPPLPSPLSPWWKSPSIIPLSPSTPKLENEIEDKRKAFSQKINKEKLQIKEKMRGYEKILNEVKRRCPLP
jgi:hypothetical protein